MYIYIYNSDENHTHDLPFRMCLNLCFRLERELTHTYVCIYNIGKRKDIYTHIVYMY